ncbi:hypothetical protein FIU83_02775 [Halomonas sp. THAF5a]|uniref:hypothetical protein n=1 Tax=Halomonas sp. THAF5a TaxID=2587844 RepID=UPI0012686B64|nr:hypothetical protein [Halomonas sp. THAF5a]QFU00562.1 hypothetical protein FIU83_02775 [Halomonas sp. THAF5a]
MKVKTSPECPKCGHRMKRFPPGRKDEYHVHCAECDYDFGRFDYFQAQFRHAIEELEAQLKHHDAADGDRG